MMDFDLQGLASTTGQTVMIILGVSLLLLFVGGLIILYTINKQYKKYKVVVFKRYKNKEGVALLHMLDLNEKGALKKDKKLNKWVFHLRKRNIDMGQDEGKDFDEEREIDLPSIPYALGGEVVFVEELGKRKYAFAESPLVEGQIKFQVSTADVAEAIRAYDMHVKTFAGKDNALLAFAMYVVFAILILILIVVVLNKLETLQQFGDKWLEGAKIMSSSSANTVPSTVPG